MSDSLTVSSVDDPPVGSPESYETDEDEPLSITAAQGVLANDTDADGNGLANALNAFNGDSGMLVISQNGALIGWNSGGTIIDVHNNDPGVFWEILHDQHVSGVS